MCVCTPKWFITKQADLGMSHKPGDPIWPHLVLANHHMSLHGPHTDPPTAEGISSGKVRNVAVVNWRHAILPKIFKWIVNGHFFMKHPVNLQGILPRKLMNIPFKDFLETFWKICLEVLLCCLASCFLQLQIGRGKPPTLTASWLLRHDVWDGSNFVLHILHNIRAEEHHKRIDCEFHVGHVQLDQIG